MQPLRDTYLYEYGKYKIEASERRDMRLVISKLMQNHFWKKKKFFFSKQARWNEQKERERAHEFSILLYNKAHLQFYITIVKNLTTSLCKYVWK